MVLFAVWAKAQLSLALFVALPHIKGGKMKLIFFYGLHPWFMLLFMCVGHG